MRYLLGLSAGYHDAAATVIREDGEIVFAGHSERYSRIKNDPTVAPGLLADLGDWYYDTVAYYERPWMHNIQQLWSGQHRYGPWSGSAAIRRHLGEWYQSPASRELTFPHHLSHAAAGFQTSPFDHAAVVVVDAIGELDTISIYRAWYDEHGRAQYQRMWRQRYPHSIGLFYSAITQAVGLRPQEDEYVTMGMAAYGSNLGAGYMRDQYVEDISTGRFKKNLHLGVDSVDLEWYDSKCNIAAAAQAVTEQLLDKIMARARTLTGSRNLVYQGGVALNCVANSRILHRHFERTWIMPNPGDAGASLGAAALALGRRLQWRDAFLGHEIPGNYPVKPLLDQLITNKIVGVASGRAEFGPRALGNRSLLADPRGSDIRDRVNEIKQRQLFRPFAPVILEEHCSEYFIMRRNCNISRYMQSVGRCRDPKKFPAIVHVDGTSRVQTVPAGQSGIRQLLEAWYMLTGCPMLLNTSLNIRGEPMVNDREDADRFENLYGIRVCS